MMGVLFVVLAVAAGCRKKPLELRALLIITDYDWGGVNIWNPSTGQLTTFVSRGLWAARAGRDGVVYALRQTNPGTGIRNGYEPECDAVVKVIGAESIAKPLFTEQDWVLSDLAVTKTQLIVLMHRRPDFEAGKLVWLSYDGQVVRELAVPGFARRVFVLFGGEGLLLSDTRVGRAPRVRLLDQSDKISEIGAGSLAIPLTSTEYLYEDDAEPSCVYKRSLDGKNAKLITCKVRLVGPPDPTGRYVVVSWPTAEWLAEYTELGVYDLKTGDRFPIMKVGKDESIVASWLPQ